MRGFPIVGAAALLLVAAVIGASGESRSLSNRNARMLRGGECATEGCHVGCHEACHFSGGTWHRLYKGATHARSGWCDWGDPEGDFAAQDPEGTQVEEWDVEDMLVNCTGFPDIYHTVGYDTSGDEVYCGTITRSICFDMRGMGLSE